MAISSGPMAAAVARPYCAAAPSPSFHRLLQSTVRPDGDGGPMAGAGALNAPISLSAGGVLNPGRIARVSRNRQGIKR
jgi:hypothetical protein